MSSMNQILKDINKYNDEYPPLDLSKKTIWSPTQQEFKYFNNLKIEREEQIERERKIKSEKQVKKEEQQKQLNVNAQPFTNISYSPPPTPMVNTQFNNQFIPIPQYTSQYGTTYTPQLNPNYIQHYTPQYGNQYHTQFGNYYYN